MFILNVYFAAPSSHRIGDVAFLFTFSATSDLQFLLLFDFVIKSYVNGWLHYWFLILFLCESKCSLEIYED